jgi:hypothetical protein
LQVLDGDQVGPGGAEHRQQLGQAAGPVVDGGEHDEPPAGFGFVPADQSGDHTEVDVAARQHDARGALFGGLDRSRQQCRDANGAGALDVELRPGFEGDA